MEQSSFWGRICRLFTAEMMISIIKTVIAASLGLFTVVAGSKFTSTQLQFSGFIACHLGLWIYFYFFLICAAWNPLFSWMSQVRVPFFGLCRHFVFHTKELALIMIVTLVGGGFAWVGWMRQIYIQTVLIPQNAMTNATWKQYELLNLFTEKVKLFPNDAVADETVIGGFINGIEQSPGWIPLTKIPFFGWSNMFYWGGLVFLIVLLSISMLMIVNRQWIRNEKLAYPLTYFAEALFKKENPSDHIATALKGNLFWGAFTFVSFLHLYNYAAAWWPKYIFPIRLGTYLDGLDTYLPAMSHTGAWSLCSVKLYFVIFGIAYFLSPSLSLSVGLNALLYLIFASQVYLFTGAPPADVSIQSMRAGAYLAFALMLIFMGRRYYGKVIWKALGFGTVKEDEKVGVAGARLFLCSFTLTVLLLNWMGLELISAVTFTLILLVVYLVFTRIICEAGIPYLSAPFVPVLVESRILGAAAMGPANVMLKGLLSGIFFGDIRQLLMPYLATGAKLADSVGLKGRRIFGLMTIASVIALGLSFVISLWQYYSFGIKTLASKTSGWRMGVGEAISEITKLHINGNFDVSSTAGFFDRIGMISPSYEVVVFFILGLAAVFLCGFMRVRFLWWPFHAMIFCFWNTPPANAIWFSFLLGWFVRMLIVKFGGERSYLQFKPLFLGMVFGEIFAGGAIMLIGLVYYLVNKSPSLVVYNFFLS